MRSCILCVFEKCVLLCLLISIVTSCSVLNYHSNDPFLKLKRIKTVNDVNFYHLKLKNSSSEDMLLKNVSLYNIKDDFESLEFIPNKLIYPDFLRKKKSADILIVLDSRIEIFEVNVLTEEGYRVKLIVEKE